VRIVSVAAARWHNVLRRSDGTIRTWGWNRYGQLGDGSLVDDIADVDAEARATLLVSTDGNAWTFGTNALSDSAVPVQVTGVTDIVGVAALAEGGMLLSSDGTVWGFSSAQNAGCELTGESHIGETGILGPMAIPGLAANITAVSSGSYHTVALDAEGTAWVWGSRFGCTPSAVLDNVVAIAAGSTNLCLFLRGDGSAWAMGFNLHGQLGNGTTISSYTTPTQVVGLTNVVGIAAGNRHSMFLKDDGTLWVAGWNHDCQLGLGEAVGDFVTVPTPVDLTDVVAVAGGQTHSVAVRSDDTVWVWGLNSVGQLSGGTQTSLPYSVCTPAQIEFDTEQ
jgi:alpha-tubulin suppressor-like RCC1 family protein